MRLQIELATSVYVVEIKDAMETLSLVYLPENLMFCNKIL